MAFLVFDKHTTLGAMFIGFSVSSAFFGVMCAQTWTYINRYPQDRLAYKILVAMVWLIELADQILIGHASYFYTISNWGDVYAFVKKPIWSIILQVTLGSLAGTIVKICFAMRVYRFSQRNKLVTGIIFVSSAAQMAIACFYTVKALELANLLQAHRIKTLGTCALALGVATDIFTAGALCFFLRNLRTGYTKDDSLINRLALYAVNTGILTSACSLACLIMYNLNPDDCIFTAIYFVLSKLYGISFLATLNTRRVLRGRGTDNEATTMPTFLMVGKLTKHEPDDVEICPPRNSMGSAFDIGIEQDITITKEPLRNNNPPYVMAI